MSRREIARMVARVNQQALIVESGASSAERSVALLRLRRLGEELIFRDCRTSRAKVYVLIDPDRQKTVRSCWADIKAGDRHLQRIA